MIFCGLIGFDIGAVDFMWLLYHLWLSRALPGMPWRHRDCAGAGLLRGGYAGEHHRFYLSRVYRLSSPCFVVLSVPMGWPLPRLASVYPFDLLLR